uniref:Uncharacterized protein n=1 Tax=Bombyx mori TaxID=7091 RepID=A0A8R2LW63_BOMMO|nr:zinc finger protein 43-like [Bombyx mori]
MEESKKLCRACLGVENLKKIENSQLEETFRLLSGDQVFSSRKPYIFCHLCHAQLLICHRFRERCQHSNEVLEQTLNNEVLDSDDISTPSHVKATAENVEYNESKNPILTEVYIESENKERDDTNIKDENIKELVNVNIKNELNDHDCKNFCESNEGLDDLDTETHKKNTLTKELVENEEKTLVTELNNETKKRTRKKKFKQIGKYFETKQNMANFEHTYDLNIITLSTEDQYKEILKRKNGFSYPFRCSLCYKSYMDDDNLNKHFKKLHDPSRGDEVCDICKTRYRDKKMLKRHMKTHRLKFACRQCKHVSILSSQAVEHYNMHRGQVYKCQNCDKTYDKQTTYLAHIRYSHPSKCIWCELCGESYVSETGLKCHQNLVHKELKYPPNAKCANCETRFLNNEAYRTHSLSCNKSASMPGAACAHCGRSFDSRPSLREHLLETHGNKKNDKLYPCTKCKKTFARASRRGAHYRRAHAAQRAPAVVCERCGKALPNTTILRYHMRTHTGERPFQCPDCPKGFVKQSSLKSHSTVHTSERSFACELCPKTFKWRSGLRTHQQTVHFGIKLPARRKNQPQVAVPTIF